VDFVWTHRQRILFLARSGRTARVGALWIHLRWFFRLTSRPTQLEFIVCLFLRNSPSAANVVTVQRFEELINGREYLIEVSEVGVGRWRAQIARLPGGCSALMPFYGATPADAAKQLAAWLSRAHSQATNPV